jgi:hypothetical protein
MASSSTPRGWTSDDAAGLNGYSVIQVEAEGCVRGRISLGLSTRGLRVRAL